jgi:hypothetical protein
MLNAAHILYTATACYPGSRVVIVPGYLIVLPGHRTRTVLREIGLLTRTRTVPHPYPDQGIWEN